MSVWPTHKLAEVCTIISGQSPESKYYNTAGEGLPFFQGKADFGDLYPTIRTYCSNPVKIAEANDILLSVRAPVGPTNLAPAKVCIGRGLTAIRPGEKLLTKFVLLFFKYFEATLAQQGTGTTFNAITQAVVKNLDIPAPSLAEQQRIVAKIEELFSELDNSVAALKQTKAQLSVYRQAVYAAAFNINNRLIPITHAFDISSGLTKNSKRNDFPQKFPYLRVANVYYNKLDLKEIKHIGATEAEIQKTLLKVDDLLFVEGNGSKSQIGRVALWDGSIPVCLHQNHIIKARAKGSTLPLFALYYMMSTHGRKQILDVASSTSGLYTLSANKIKSLSIPDCSIDEQEQIIFDIEGQLSTCEDIEATITKTLQQAESLRQSILKQAFEGKLV